MAVKKEQIFNTFVKGLVTEASALTFPENSSVDEENFGFVTKSPKKH